jgi:hypothetical protein
MPKGTKQIKLFFEVTKDTTEKYVEDYTGLIYSRLPKWMRVD